MKKISCLLITFVAFSCQTELAYKIDGELKKWHKVTLTFEGPETNENDSINPFLDYRLVVSFTNDDKEYQVHGFYAADGSASESGTVSGNKWQVRFVPDAIGDWSFKASFQKGNDIAVNNQTGESSHFDGIEGSFSIAPTDKTGNDFRAKGRLINVGGHYLHHAETNEVFLKGGVDSPENLLGYVDFDGTYFGGESDEQREGESATYSNLHRYGPHLQDWKEGDPTWQNGKGKGLIGGLNYLASKGINSVYMLTNNVDGDGKDVFPWTTYNEDFTRFDVSKLDQWEIVFDHMDKLGIMCHFVTQETENELLLNNGNLGRERKLYYRELIARFAHHLGVTWNLGEENGPAPWMGNVGQNDQQRKDMASYIKAIDPYQNMVVVHTIPSEERIENVLSPLLGFEPFDGPSLQTDPHRVHEETLKWRSKSAQANKKWIVSSDEIGPAHAGALPDEFDPQHDTIRYKVLWGNLMAGGAGVEWYFGYRYPHNDLQCEDWRSRDILYDQTRYAVNFFRNYLPIEKMKPNDDLISSGYGMQSGDSLIVLYKPWNENVTLNLPKKSYSMQFYDPRNGGHLSDPTNIDGGVINLNDFPDSPERDWVVLLKGVE